MKFGATILASAMLMAAIQSAFGGDYLIMGGGTVRCGEWTRLRVFSDSQRGHVVEVASLYQLYAWIDGYVSGVNVASGETRQPDMLMSKPQGAGLYAVIDNYCKANPLDTVADATMVLVRELRKRAMVQ
jgi:hypothetical protein